MKHEYSYSCASTKDFFPLLVGERPSIRLPALHAHIKVVGTRHVSAWYAQGRLLPLYKVLSEPLFVSFFCFLEKTEWFGELQIFDFTAQVTYRAGVKQARSSSLGEGFFSSSLSSTAIARLRFSAARAHGGLKSKRGYRRRIMLSFKGFLCFEKVPLFSSTWTCVRLEETPQTVLEHVKSDSGRTRAVCFSL